MKKEYIEKFLEFSESLKLVRKAEIESEGKTLIDEIYTDLLPNNGIINKVNLPRTTILVGRKGTGKSTIFLKSQKDIDLNKKFLSIYIDVKSLFDNSTPKLPEEIEKISDSQELIKYLIYSNFIKEIIIKVKEKLKHRLEKKNFIMSLGLSSLLLVSVFEQLDEIENSIDNVFKNLNSSLVLSFKNTIDKKVQNKKSSSLKLDINKGISADLSQENSEENCFKKEFDNQLVVYLDLKKCFIENILKIREILSIKHLFIYLDDYSEIDKYAQELFMDWFIAPVNNLSDDFVKFKIATYPKRFYYGKLDNSKIDEISLDFFDAYYSYEKKSDNIDITKMEHLALDYTERLINNRLKVYFPNNNWESLFEMDLPTLYELLFNVSMNVPRKIGYVLSYCYESSLIHSQKIGTKAIENAALRYYTDVVEKYFLVNEFICKPFEDKISNQYQYELLGVIVQRQITNKKFLAKKQTKDTGHFYVNNEFCYLLDNLELNGFITTYNKVKDSNNIFSTLYSIDFGLCKKHRLTYGKPSQKKANSHTLPPIFNFNTLIFEYFNTTQVIECENGHEFPYSQLHEFKMFEMNCPICLKERKFSKCVVRMKFQDVQEKFNNKEKTEKIRITFQEFLVLNFLVISQTSVALSRISSSLDIALSTINNIVNKMIDKEMIEFDISVSEKLNKEHIKITTKGVKTHKKIELILKEVKELKNSQPLTSGHKTERG